MANPPDPLNKGILPPPTFELRLCSPSNLRAKGDVVSRYQFLVAKQGELKAGNTNGQFEEVLSSIRKEMAEIKVWLTQPVEQQS